jgi:hypothetical protein
MDFRKGINSRKIKMLNGCLSFDKLLADQGMLGGRLSYPGP